MFTQFTPFRVAAAAFGGASGHAAGNGVSSSAAGAIKWCSCQCISATAAGGAAGAGTDVALVAVEPHISGATKMSKHLLSTNFCKLLEQPPCGSFRENAKNRDLKN